jgi:hypothetical protein
VQHERHAVVHRQRSQRRAELVLILSGDQHRRRVLEIRHEQLVELDRRARGPLGAPPAHVDNPAHEDAAQPSTRGGRVTKLRSRAPRALERVQPLPVRSPVRFGLARPPPHRRLTPAGEAMPAQSHSATGRDILADGQC